MGILFLRLGAACLREFDDLLIVSGGQDTAIFAVVHSFARVREGRRCPLLFEIDRFRKLATLATGMDLPPSLWSRSLSAIARIIMLNGVGSAGKSSIARALQAMTDECFLYVAMDAFLEMLPARYWNHPDTFIYRIESEDGKPSVAIETRPGGVRLMRGMRRAIAELARQGNSLIVDEVMLGADDRADYDQLLAEFAFFVVGVFAPLDVLEERERRRGDRMIGLARWQYKRVHAGITYDFEVDTSTLSPMECAERIKAKFGL
jgi:chloramphenicol 3-O phosphotransferase